MAELREHERRTLSTLCRLNGRAEAQELIRQSRLSDAAVMRAAMTLQEKGLVKIHERQETLLKLNAEGKLHSKKGLPERRLLKSLENLRVGLV